MLAQGVLPELSVVVVNYRGAENTVACLRALRDELDYPPDRLQVICVDNASGGDDADRIAAVAGVELVRSEENLGFAGGCNLGAAHARGQVLAFINNDARPHPQWARAAVRTLAEHPDVACVASKVLDWDGEKIDFVDGGLTWFGMGYKRHAGEVDDGSHDAPRDVLFATGSAMVVRMGAFAELGGFDERFFMFYEDVDLGWRLNLRGWRVRYEPTSLTYHRHHASMDTVDTSEARELYLLERNALAALYKNLSAETLAKALPAALALAVRRATARGDIDPEQLEIRDRDSRTVQTSIAPSALAGVLAIDRFVELLPSLTPSREEVQATRVRSDADLLPLMRRTMEPAYPLPRYLAAHDILVEAFGLESAFGARRRVLVVTGDAIADRMAGPAIRAWNMADVLSAEHEVRLVTVNPVCAPPRAGFPVLGVRRRDLPTQVDWADVVVLQGHALELAPELKRASSTKIVVCDVYDPMHLELLEQSKDQAETGIAEQRELDLIGVTKVLNAQLERGDYFICASERQRHFWLGHLLALGRLTPDLYDADPTLRSLLDVVPFGLPGKPPQRSRSPIKGELVGGGDKVVLWAGGVYSWFDPLTLVEAMGELAGRRPDARLVFLGMKHPNPEVPEMDIGARVRALSSSLGLTGEHVFFNESWVPYEQRQDWLLDADCGVTTHFEHVETTFAFRTRVLDYLWAGLPIVTTDGDSFASLVRREGLGVVVPSEDPVALAAALEKVLYDEEFAAACRERIAVVAQRFTWETVLAPLTAFCRDPRPAADRLPGASALVRRPALSVSGRVRRDLGLVKEYLDAGGAGELARRAAGRVRRVARERLGGRADG